MSFISRELDSAIDRGDLEKIEKIIGNGTILRGKQVALIIEKFISEEELRVVSIIENLKKDVLTQTFKYDYRPEERVEVKSDDGKQTYIRYVRHFHQDTVYGYLLDKGIITDDIRQVFEEKEANFRDTKKLKLVNGARNTKNEKI